MSSEPLVTIITPSYNQGNFIGATLDSVLSQSYTKLELLVMDGGSSDDTVTVLKSYNDPRLRWVSEKDSGQSEAINKGLRAAKGEYLTYLNSDDLLLPGAIQFVVDYFGEHPDSDLVYGDCQFIDVNGQPISVEYSNPFNLAQYLSVKQTVIQPGAFWRRQVTASIGDMDEALHFTMDADYWIRTALAGFELTYSPGVRSAFRLHDTSKTVSQKSKFWDNWIAVLNKVYAAPVPVAVEAVKDAAYEYIRWNQLKASWLEGHYDRAALQSFRQSSSVPRRLLAGVMWIESYLHIPLLKSIDTLYGRLSGQQIIR